MTPKVIVMQKGAREHYLAARALHRRGMLALLVVDWYAPRNRFLMWILSLFKTERSRSALAARAHEIPDDLVCANRLCGIRVKWMQSWKRSERTIYERALEADSTFTQALAQIQTPPHDVLFSYSYMSLEVLRRARNNGVLTILCQIDPGPCHFHIVAEEMQRNPDLAGMPQPFPEEYFDRLRQEWRLSDVIVVNSEWTRDALIAEGVEPSKIEVLQLAYEVSGVSIVTSCLASPAAGLLRVLCLGQVTPGKGIKYLLDAARILENENVHIDVVGPLGILPEAVALAPGNMTFHGAVSRDRATEWYQSSDVFVLPTLSDGFALTQLEALAHGLPVIATPNCARVVEDGKTGYIVPARDAQALADAILRFVSRPGLAAEMAPQCREAVQAYSVDAYGQRLGEIIEKHKAQGAQSTNFHCRQ